HPALPNVVFAATGSGVYRSTDFGSTWTLTTDGMQSTTRRVVVDTTTPNPVLYYAVTTDGVYRTVNAGVTRAPINQGYGGGIASGLTLYGNNHIFVASNNGLWVTSSGDATGAKTPHWRHVDETGLNGNDLMWAVSGFLAPPGTLIVGTQSNGGYSFTFVPP